MKGITHIKVTGGSLKAKQLINGEKINQIRIYSGEKYTSVNEAVCGSICAITGLEGHLCRTGIRQGE